MDNVKERIKQEVEILARYQDLKKVDQTYKLQFVMDMEYSKVNLKKLMEESDKDFIDDVAGILCSMDRENMKLVGFTPKAGFEERT